LTPTAWRLGWIGLGLLAAAVNTGNNLLYLLIGLLLATLPISWVASRANLSVLRVDFRPPRSARAGSSFTVEVTIRHAGRRWDARGIEVSVLTDRGQYGPGFIERVPAGTTTRILLTGRHDERGVRSIRGVQLGSTFPIGFLERIRRFPFPLELVVLPSEATGGEVRRTVESLAGQAILASAVPGNEYEGLRRGGDTDDMRRVDWKSTARRGVLMLRETAGEARQRVDLNLVTRRSGDARTMRRRFERDVSRLAATGRGALDAGGTVRLTLDGRNAVTFAGKPGLAPFLSRLARVVGRDDKGRPLPEKSATIPPGPADADPGRTRRTPAGRSHRFSSAAALAVGLTALFAYGGIGPIVFAVTAVSLALSLVFPRLIARPRGVPYWIWRAAAVLALGAFGADLILRQNPLFAALNLVLFITLYQVFNAATARDDRLMLLLSMLQLVLAAALTTEVSFALPLLAWILAAIHTLVAWTVLPPAGGGRRRTVQFDSAAARPRYGTTTLAVTAALLIIGLLLFMIIPHVGTGTYNARGATRQRVSGFSDSATLGDIGRIKLDGAQVMDVELTGRRPPDLDLRWRGVALDSFDGRTWSRAGEDPDWLSADELGRFVTDGRGLSNERLLTQQVRLEPSDTQVLFAAEHPVRIASRDFSLVRQDGTRSLEARTRRGKPIAYSVTSRWIPRDPAVLRRETGGAVLEESVESLALPPLDPRIPELAQRLTAGTDNRYDAARAIEAWLSTERTYTLDVADASRPDPLSAFLFDGMGGHCEYFATSMVVLARSAGIPSRLVTGYLRGETNFFSRRFIVRQSDAHAWVEVHFPESGWVPFDPTPEAGRGVRDETGLADVASDLHATIKRWWDDYLIGIDLQDQVTRLGRLKDALGAGAEFARDRFGMAFVIALVLGSFLLALKRGSWGRVRVLTSGSGFHERPPEFYRKLLALLARRGVLREAQETPAELAVRAAKTLPPVSSTQLRQLTDLYYRVRFDEGTTERQVRRLADALLSELELADAPR
jgi:transglutaminase-like putative cysteine protease/uncharacterized protein (DUF58 family)